MRWKRLISSWADAVRGLRQVGRAEQNFRVQLVAAALVVALAAALPLERWEVVALIVAVAIVLLLEIVNSALERCSDLLKPRLHAQVLVIKDIMAGAVLLASLTALAIGALVFIPHLVLWLK